MKIKDILLEIIENLEKYETVNSNQNSALSTSDFLEFMNMKQRFSFTDSKRETLSGGNDNWRQETSQSAELNTDVSILVILLYRYAKGYIKKALADSELRNGDDFSFLITLMTHESLTKIELTKMLVMEKTSGNEIINRLVKMKFIEQTPDQNDGRSMRIRITDNGKNQVLKVLPKMREVSKIVTGDLDKNEIRVLSYLLRRLDDYHDDIYHNKKNYELSDLLG